MVPSKSDPPEPGGAFSAEIERDLRVALRDPWTGTAPPDLLRRALRAAAREARERGLKAEDLLIAFKTLERHVELQRTPTTAHPDRNLVIRALIEAYYE